MGVGGSRKVDLNDDITVETSTEYSPDEITRPQFVQKSHNTYR